MPDVDIYEEARDDVIRQLAEYGVDVRTIAAALDVSVSRVATKITTRTKLVPEDEKLADAMRTLAWRAYHVAMDTLDFGTPSDQMNVMRIVLGNTSKLIGAATEASQEEERAAVDRIFEAQRRLPIPQILDAASTHTAPLRTDDRN